MNAIAIVGMGCRFAGARDLHAFWDMTLQGRDGFGPVPADRWPAAAFFDENRRATDKTYAPAGAFIDDIRSFPALHLGIPPRRVEVMDPQQRASIEVALEAIADAGYRPSEMPRRTGVFVGVTASEFRVVLSSRTLATLMAAGSFGEVPADPDMLARAVANVVPSRPFTAPGALANMIAAAVAQELDLHGPAYTVDAACASAMVAVADAVAQLRARQIDAAVAGGVYLQLTPEHYIAFSRIGAISGAGRCRPFDARADGFVQGDGAGAVILKRLDDAVRDGDRIYAVLHGIATNNDGRGEGPMAPVLSGQVEVIVEAWKDAGGDPAHLGYLEAHGTGTDVGDETELKGLREALGERAQTVQLGSSKGNVGHTMSAAGVAGLIRASLALHHRTIPPMASFEGAKPELGLESGAFRVPTAPVAWDGEQRLAGVSSFGFGGTNGHAVLGAAPLRVEQVELGAGAAASDPLEVVRFSAADPAALRQTALALAASLREQPLVGVASVSRAWAVRPSLAHRAALVAASREELLDKLDRIGLGEVPKGVTVGAPGPQPPKVAFLFPGQGAQRVGMLGALRDRFPVVAQALREAERDLGDLLPVPLSHLMWPERRAVPVDAATADAELTDTAACQPALVAAGLACWRLLETVGVTPVVAGGHSLGEFAAAVVGGVLSPADSLRFAAVRGRAMAEVAGDRGAMAALLADGDTARGLLVDGAVIANENHPRQVVVSGRTDAVRAVVERAGAAGVEARPVHVSHGFHSPIFAGLDSSAWTDAIDVKDPGGVAVASGIADRPYRDRADAVSVFRRHASSPVRFGRLLEQCVDLGADVFVQVGAGGPLASFARASLGERARAVLTLASTDDADGGRSALETLGALWVHGVALDTRPITAPAAVASVPPIALPRERYWPIKDEPQLALKMSGVVVERPAAAAAAVEPAAVEAAAGPDEVWDRVAAVVAKVSSYPRASLRPEQGLVDDLGFDSLMVADLASGLAEAFPGLGGLPRELLVDRPTVQGITDYVRGARDGGAAAADDDLPLGAFRPVYRACPLPESGVPAGWLAGATVLVTGGRDPEITAALKHAGANVTRTARGPVDLVVHVAPFEELVPVSAVYAGEVPVPDRAAELLAVLDAQVELGGRPSVVAVRRDDDPWAEAVCGVVRAVAREWPDRVAKSVRFAGVDAARRAARLVQELVSSDRSPDVRWSAEGRQVAGQEPVETAQIWTPSAADTVLVTGGTRGIGLAFAHRLAAAGARVVLVGRGTPSGELPAGAVVVGADVTDRVGLTRAVSAHGPFTALVHAAGTLADGALGKVDPLIGGAARRVKIEGLVHAVAAAGSPPVVLAVGSWAGRFGNRHQAHYAAANAALAGLASSPPKGVRLVVSEFGPWSDSEMVRTLPPAVQAAMRAEGVDFVGDRAGLDALWADLCGGSGEVVRGRRVPWWNRVRTVSETLSTDTHPYLLDHAIEGVPVLPLAAACDLIAAAAGVPMPFEVRDLRLFTGVTVQQPVRVEVSVEGERVELRFSTTPSEGGKGERRTLAYRATVRPAVAPEVAAAPVGGEPPKTDPKRFYSGLTFHGRRLQGLLAVDGVGPDFVRGRVRGSKPADWISEPQRAHWTVDPLALDSAFQLAAVVAWDRYQRAGTPVALGRMVMLRPLPSGPIRVEGHFHPSGRPAAVLEGGESEGDRFTASFVFRDADGGVLAVAEGAVANLARVEGVEPAFEVKREWIDATAWPEVKDLEMRLEAATMLGIQNPYFHVHEGTARNTTTVGGRQLVNFSSYNYLGLSGDERVLDAVGEAIRRYGTSVSASRVASGERPFHRELEAELAAAQGVDDSLVFTAGHMTNVNVIGHLMKPADLVLHDELIHDSVLQGIKLSGAGRRAFRHDDPESLEKLLKELRPHVQKCLIVVEGVYSMDGDVCRLPEYARLKKKYGCLLLVDEAHSFGVCGATGCGVGEHFRDSVGFDPRDVDLWMGTLSKSLSSCGGWIAGAASLIRYLRYTAPGFVYSAGITPANGTAALASLRLMLAEPWRVQRLQANARTFHDALVARGVDTGPAKGGSAVVPTITGNSMHALLLSQRLRDQGVNVQPIVYPAVADDAARLRFFLSSTHETDELLGTAEKVADTLAGIRKEFPAN